MLVSMATNATVSANTSETYTYSPSSVQKVLIRLEDADWEESQITVQIGSKNICNGVMSWGLMLQTQTLSGHTQATADAYLVLDFGSHQCLSNDNLYVTVQAGSALTLTDVSAIVDEPFSGSFPVKYTEYSDSTFTGENVLTAFNYDNALGSVAEDAFNCEVKTKLYSSAPSFISSSSYYASKVINSSYVGFAGILCRHQVPLTTTFNYSASAATDRILTVQAMGSSNAEVQKAKRTAQIARSAVSRR